MPRAFAPESEGLTYVGQATVVTASLARCKAGPTRPTRIKQPIDAPQEPGIFSRHFSPVLTAAASICASDAVCRIGLLLDLCYIGVHKPD